MNKDRFVQLNRQCLSAAFPTCPALTQYNVTPQVAMPKPTKPPRDNFIKKGFHFVKKLIGGRHG